MNHEIGPNQRAVDDTGNAMNSGMSESGEKNSPSEVTLLPKDRTILEREAMEFRPFGLDEQGHTIRDLSGGRVGAGLRGFGGLGTR